MSPPMDTMNQIGAAVCQELGVSMSDVRGPGRQRHVSLARGLIAWLARRNTDWGYQPIAYWMNLTYPSVMTAERRVEAHPERKAMAERLHRSLVAS